MKWQGGRQSDNVSEATPADYQQTQDYVGRSSKKLTGLKPIQQYQPPASQRTGQASTAPDFSVDTGQDDHPFFQHIQKDNLSGQ